MATFKLTDQTWQDREYEKTKGVLFQALGGANRDGVDASELREKLAYAGLTYYTNADLLAFKNRLIADGLAEEVGTLTIAERVMQPVNTATEKMKTWSNIERLAAGMFGILQIEIIIYIVLNVLGIL